MRTSTHSATARLRLYARALRLPFVGASALPYVLGVASADTAAPSAALAIALGLCAVVGAHLCANLVNDVADTDSGADAVDPTHHGLFGGSKVICDGLLERSAVLRGARLAGTLATAALLGLALLRESALPLGVAGVALALALAYSLPPCKLAYRGWGEITVALLFGPVTVLAGHYARSGLMFSPQALALGGVAGLLTAAVLVANEVPDAEGDAQTGKRTLVVRVGARHGWLLFAAAVVAAYGLIAGLVGVGHLSRWALVALAGLWPAVGAVAHLRRAAGDKRALRGASARAIGLQAGVVMSLILERSL